MKAHHLKKSAEGSNVLTATPHERALAALLRMKKNGIHHLPVLENGKVVGLVSDRDILSRALYIGMGDELSWLSVQEAMVKDVPPITSASEVGEILRLMVEGRYSALPIIEDSQLKGIITESDILRLTANLLEKNEKYNLGAVYLANPLTQKFLSLIADLGI